MKNLKEKIEKKIEDKHESLEKTIRWLRFRRFISGFVVVFSAFLMYIGGADLGLFLFIFFCLPALIIYGLQSNRIRKHEEELLTFEKMILSTENKNNEMD